MIKEADKPRTKQQATGDKKDGTESHTVYEGRCNFSTDDRKADCLRPCGLPLVCVRFKHPTPARQGCVWPQVCACPAVQARVLSQAPLLTQLISVRPAISPASLCPYPARRPLPAPLRSAGAAIWAISLIRRRGLAASSSPELRAEDGGTRSVPRRD